MKSEKLFCTHADILKVKKAQETEYTPHNKGGTWHEVETKALEEKLLAGDTLEFMCRQHGRTPGAILAQLNRQKLVTAYDELSHGQYWWTEHAVQAARLFMQRRETLAKRFTKDTTYSVVSCTAKDLTSFSQSFIGENHEHDAWKYARLMLDNGYMSQIETKKYQHPIFQFQLEANTLLDGLPFKKGERFVYRPGRGFGKSIVQQELSRMFRHGFEKREVTSIWYDEADSIDDKILKSLNSKESVMASDVKVQQVTRIEAEDGSLHLTHELAVAHSRKKKFKDRFEAEVKLTPAAKKAAINWVLKNFVTMEIPLPPPPPKKPKVITVPAEGLVLQDAEGHRIGITPKTQGSDRGLNLTNSSAIVQVGHHNGEKISYRNTVGPQSKDAYFGPWYEGMPKWAREKNELARNHGGNYFYLMKREDGQMYKVHRARMV